MRLVPFSYNLRSLFARSSATLLTVLSIAATVAVLAGMLALQQGFARMFVERGDADVAIFLRPGATSEGESGITRDRVDALIKSTPEIATGDDGQPLASAEVFLAIRRAKLDGGEVNVGFRGVQPRSYAVHGERFAIVEGTAPQPGADELIVGRALRGRIRDCNIDDVLVVNTTPFRVVGVFSATGQHDSEIWGDADRLLEALQRPVYSRVFARLQPGTDVAALSARLEAEPRIFVKAIGEPEYLSSQTGALSATFISVGVLLGIIMGLAAIFTGTNSMLAAIAARGREIGILLSLGFRPWALFVSFLFEAALLGLLGGLLGCLLVLPLNGIETGTINMATFSEIAFSVRINAVVLGGAVAFAVLLGLIGGAIPAWRAARMTPTEALRRA